MPRATPHAATPQPPLAANAPPQGDQELLRYCYQVAEAVARGVRFADVEARLDCTADAALYLFKQIGRYDPLRSTATLRGYAGMIVHRRLCRLAALELRNRRSCRIRHTRTTPWRPGAPRRAPRPAIIRCRKCRQLIADELDRQVAATTRLGPDQEHAAWIRSIVLRQRAALLGEAPDETDKKEAK